MPTKTKTRDCVEMKRRAQAKIMAEYETRKDEFSSYAEYLSAKVHESEWQRSFWAKLRRAPCRKPSLHIRTAEAWLRTVREPLCALLTTEPAAVAEVARQKPARFNVKGVYVITTPDDSKVVYVGKTRTKTVIGRIQDHRNTDTASDLRGMVKLFPDYPQDKDAYQVRCLEVENERERSFLEHFVIGVLRPPFNKQ